jgi:hypothetical protein
MTTGGVLLTDIQWIQIGDVTKTPYHITDCISISATKSIEIKNNILTLNLKNSPVNYSSSDTYTRGDYVNSSDYSSMFSQFDQFTVYMKYTDDATDYGTYNFSISDNLIGVFMGQEYHTTTTDNSTMISLQAADSAYYLFNKVFNFSYGVANSFTAPGIIRKLSRTFSDGTSNVNFYYGTHNDTGTKYSIDSRFVTEGGKILDYRRPGVGTAMDNGPSGTLNGDITSGSTTINITSVSAGAKAFEVVNGTIVIETEHIAYTAFSGSAFTGCTRGIDDTVAVAHTGAQTIYQGFPLVLITKNYAAIFEWFADLAQTLYTNYIDEVGPGNVPFYSRAFLFWLDKNNVLNYMPANDDVASTVTLGDEQLKGWKIDRSVFDAVNFVIFNCGTDMDGHGIIYYWYDDAANVAGLKMRYQPMTQVANGLIIEDEIANPTRDTSNTQDKLKQYPSSYPMTPSFISLANNFRALPEVGLTPPRTNVANNSEYNECYREACKFKGLSQAQQITAKRAGLRYVGQIVTKGTIYNPGDLIRVNNKYVGVNSQLIRVLEVTHQVNNKGWITTLKVEEDEKTIFGQNYPG